MTDDKKLKHMLYAACQAGNLILIKYMINHDHEYKKLYRKELAYIAIDSEQIDVIKYLYKIRKMRKLIKDDPELLQYAVSTGNMSIIKFLIQKRAPYGGLAIALAAAHGHLEVLKYLFIHIDPKYIDYISSVYTATMAAASFGQFDILVYLLENSDAYRIRCMIKKDEHLLFKSALESNDISTIVYLYMIMDEYNMRPDKLVAKRLNVLLHRVCVNDILPLMKFIVDLDLDGTNILSALKFNKTAVDYSESVVEYTSCFDNNKYSHNVYLLVTKYLSTTDININKLKGSVKQRIIQLRG